MSSRPPEPPPEDPGRRRRRRVRRPEGPRSLKDSLGPVVRRWGGSTDAMALASVFTRWPEIAGPALAEHVRPVRLVDGVLVVAVDHPAWATRVRASGATLLGRVGELAGETPTRLDVIVRRP
ncbi:MAG TPA: DUF721 domain-containing protein [Acidimicrobiales bacterium]|nr:DUF721 domain-containing protein [Acidimicrobiales bacterium]